MRVSRRSSTEDELCTNFGSVVGESAKAKNDLFLALNDGY